MIEKNSNTSSFNNEVNRMSKRLPIVDTSESLILVHVSLKASFIRNGWTIPGLLERYLGN